MDDAALERLSLRGPALPVAGRDADDPGPFPLARPRPDRRRAGDPRPDLERALQPQDAGRADPLPRRRASERTFENMLRETIFAATREDPPRRPGPDDWCVSVFRGQRRRGPLRRRLQRGLQGRDAQPSLGPGALRRGQHGHRRRDPRPDGHRHGRQADLQHRRLLLRPARHARRAAPARRAPSAAGDEGRGGRRARLRQPHGHPHGQRRDLLRSPLPGQPAGLLRQHRPDPPRQVVQAAPARRPDRGRRRADRPRRHPRRHVQLGRADQPERDASPAGPCRSATPSPKRCSWTCSWPPATAACTTP